MTAKDIISNILDDAAYVRVNINEEKYFAISVENWKGESADSIYHKYDEHNAKLAIPMEPAIDIEIKLIYG